MTQRFFLIALTAMAVTLATQKLTADVIELTTGDQLIGTIVSRSATETILEHPVLGTLSIPNDRIARILADSSERPKAQRVEDVEPQVVDAIYQQARAEALAEQMQAMAQEEPEPVSRYASMPAGLREMMETLAAWNVQVELGITGNEGNKPTFGIRVAGSAQREDERNRTRFSAYYYHLDTNRKTDKDEANFTALHDFLIPDSPWFGWARGAYDYNINQWWRNRVSAFGGPGYQFIDQADLALVGRVGAGLTYNFEGDDRMQPELYFGLDLLRYKPFKGHLITAGAAWMPNLAQVPQSRTDARFEYQISIPGIDGLAIKFGAVNEYQSQTQGDSKHNELRYYTTLVYGF